MAMSSKLIKEIWQCPYGDASTVLVLMALADAANDTGECTADMATIASKARQSVRNCQYLLRKLEHLGIVECFEARGRGLMNSYRLCLHNLHNLHNLEKVQKVQPLHILEDEEKGAKGATVAGLLVDEKDAMVAGFEDDTTSLVDVKGAKGATVAGFERENLEESPIYRTSLEEKDLREEKDPRENQDLNPILAVPTENGERMTTAQVDFLRAMLDRIPAKALETAPTFHEAVYTQLLQAGAEVKQEHPVPDRGDGRPGFIDLLVTAPWVIGLELDAISPRAKSIKKLQFVDGLRVILLRGRGPVVNVPEGIHAIMRHTYSVATSRRPGARVVPDTFVVTDKMRAWAEEKFPGVDIAYETEKMRDYEFKDTKTDWVRTWSRWMRTAWERLSQQTNLSANTPRSLSFAEQRHQRQMDTLREWAGGTNARPTGPTSVCDSDGPVIDGVEYHRVDESAPGRVLERPE
jgi:Helix-turn-helix domain